MSAMRAKMKLNLVDAHYDGQERLVFNAVGANKYDSTGLDEDNTFAKYSPTANLSIVIANPALLGRFKPGQTFYVDFTEVSES